MRIISSMIKQVIQTERLKTAYYRSGNKNPIKLMFLHGNLSSSEFLLPLFSELEKHFDVTAPDLRCFGDTEPLPVDASRGYRDWSDDIYALCRCLGWERFVLCGWSMGGNIAMQFAIDHAEMVDRLILLAPGSPYGFGGTRDADGVPYDPCGLGSGAGCANPGLTLAIRHQSRFVLRDILTKYYFQPPFRVPREWENKMLDAIGKIHLGDDGYPGNYTITGKWPYVIAGDKGVLNTMSPMYGNLEKFLNIKEKPPVLWIRGADDRIVSDRSIMEFGYLGQIGLVPGWPGADRYPPQPMVSQLQRYFEKYKGNNGKAVEIVIAGGHMCALESPRSFLAAIYSFCSMN